MFVLARMGIDEVSHSEQKIRACWPIRSFEPSRCSNISLAIVAYETEPISFLFYFCLYFYFASRKELLHKILARGGVQDERGSAPVTQHAGGIVYDIMAQSSLVGQKGKKASSMRLDVKCQIPREPPGSLLCWPHEKAYLEQLGYPEI